MPVRIAVLEQKASDTARWQSRAVGFFLALFLALVGGAVGYGQVIERVDSARAEVEHVREQVEGLRRDLNARGQVPAGPRVTY